MKAKLILSLLVIAGLCFVSCSDDEDEVINGGTTQTPDEQTPDEGTGDEGAGDEDTPDEGSGLYLVPDAENPDTQVTFTVIPSAYVAYNGGSGDFNIRLYSAKVTINGESLASVKVEAGSTVNYEVKCEGYQTASGSATVTKDTELEVVLEPNSDFTSCASSLVGDKLYYGYVIEDNQSGDIDYSKVDMIGYNTATGPYIEIADHDGVIMLLGTCRWCSNYNEPTSTYIRTTSNIPYTADGKLFRTSYDGYDGNTRRDFVSGWIASHSEEFEGSTGSYPIYNAQGVFNTEEETCEIWIHIGALNSGTFFTFMTGVPTGNAMVSGHYVGELECDGFLSGTIDNQGILASAGLGNHDEDMWVLLKEDPNGKLYFRMMGFDIDGYSFGDIEITGLDLGDYSTTNAYSASPTSFSVTTQCINPDGEEGYVTVAGTIELDVSGEGKLGVEINAEVTTATDSEELSLIFIGDWDGTWYQWGRWNSSYLY